MASRVEVNGSRSMVAHMAPIPMAMAGARSMPGSPLAAIPNAAPMNIEGKTGPPRNALSDSPYATALHTISTIRTASG